MKNLNVEKELMRMVVNENKVSDSTIDRARLAVVKNARINRKPRHMYIMSFIKFATCIIILVCLSFITIQASFNRSSKYLATVNYDELFKNPIDSINDFNNECDTKYRYLEGFEVTKAYNLTQGLVSMVIEEHYQTDEALITLYVADKNVIINKFQDKKLSNRWISSKNNNFLYMDSESCSLIQMIDSFNYYIEINYFRTEITHWDYIDYTISQLK